MKVPTPVPCPDWVRHAEPIEGVERIEAWFQGSAYAMHCHHTYAIGRTRAGVQSFSYRGSQRNSLPGNTLVLHPDEAHDGQAGTDEAFIVLEGELHIDFREGPSGDGSIVLRAGQMGVVPKGVEHKPWANAEVKLLLIEPRGVVNTGDGPTGERTVENDQWI